MASLSFPVLRSPPARTVPFNGRPEDKDELGAGGCSATRARDLPCPIALLPPETLEAIIGLAMPLESLGVHRLSPAAAQAQTMAAEAWCRQRAACSRLRLVCAAWKVLAERQLSRSIVHNPSRAEPSGRDLADLLEEDVGWAARVTKLMFDLENVPFTGPINATLMNPHYGRQPALDLQRSSAEVLLACPQAQVVFVYRPSGRRRSRSGPSHITLPPRPLPLDNSFVDAVVTRGRLRHLALHPASAVDLQMLSLCPQLALVEVGFETDLTKEGPVWAADGAATPRTMAPSYYPVSLLVVFSHEGCLRSSDFSRLLGRDPKSLRALELRFDGTHDSIVPALGRLTEVALTRCIQIEDLTLANIGASPSIRLGEVIAALQELYHALPQLRGLTLSRMAYYPDVFIQVCDTLLSQLDVSMHPTYTSSWVPSTAEADDLFGLLEADGAQGKALVSTIMRIGPVPKHLILNDAGLWSTPRRRALVDRCLRLGIALEASWEACAPEVALAQAPVGNPLLTGFLAPLPPRGEEAMGLRGGGSSVFGYVSCCKVQTGSHQCALPPCGMHGVGSVWPPRWAS